MQTSLAVTATLLALLLLAGNAAAEAPRGLAKATFAVHCYDVGVHALEGKPGVVSVEPGWSGSREVDRVVYNPEEVSITQLEDWLKDANTYLGTLDDSMNNEPAKEMSK
jgi:hypothetical protein